jgi:glutathionyl-hydroquinone reductase
MTMQGIEPAALVVGALGGGASIDGPIQSGFSKDTATRKNKYHTLATTTCPTVKRVFCISMLLQLNESIGQSLYIL